MVLQTVKERDRLINLLLYNVDGLGDGAYMQMVALLEQLMCCLTS